LFYRNTGEIKTSETTTMNYIQSKKPIIGSIEDESKCVFKIEFLLYE
jgi:hypothetical protein